MEIIRDISHFQTDSDMVVSIGNFDGVHEGHAHLIKRAVSMAKERGLKSGFVTFEPHPLKFFGADIKLLQTPLMKIKSFESLGADYLFLLKFDMDMAKVEPEEFVREYLLKKMRAEVIVVGYDYKFGKNRAGSYEFLKLMGEKEGFSALRVERVEIDGVTASSTNIRKFLTAGEPKEAAKLLGYNYSVGGVVVHGDGIATGIGFPTANLRVENELIPMNGIYASLVHIDGKVYGGALYIGDRPTVTDSRNRRVEVNIFGFSGDLYDKYIEAEVIELVRHDKKFSSVDELKEQIKTDCEQIRVILETRK